MTRLTLTAALFSSLATACLAIPAYGAPSSSFELWGLGTPWIFPAARTFEAMPLERTQPVVVGDIVYVARLSGQVLALHRTEGYVIWERRLPGAIEGSLTYARSKLFVGDLSGNLFALNARDGSDSWRFKVF